MAMKRQTHISTLATFFVCVGFLTLGASVAYAVPCNEIPQAIAWNKKEQTTPGKNFPVIAYMTKHFGHGALGQSHPKDAVHYAAGYVFAVDTPTPHLTGTLWAHVNSTDFIMAPKPTVTYVVKIFPDGTLSYLMKVNGKPVGGINVPTQVTATCVNNSLLTGTTGASVVTVGVAIQPWELEQPR
jgi:hypothetical protein